jgi:hypothetical protein
MISLAFSLYFLCRGRFYFIIIERVRDITVSNQEDHDMVSKLLKGRTMSVYALLITRSQMGVRDVQRALGFSSPSLALHHLSKLVEMELATKDAHGEYKVTRTVRVGSLSLFVRFGRILMPRFIFLITLFSSMLFIYLAFFISWPLMGHDIMFISLSLIAIFVVAYESRRIWLLKPF